MRAEPEQAARLIEMWQDDDVPEFDVEQITQPTLIIHGTEDVIVSIESSRKLNELIPDSKLVELSGCGHVPTMTRPKEVYEEILKYFPLKGFQG
jgi:pimeloyl-ACP methyl ester carboxylesterase